MNSEYIDFTASIIQMAISMGFSLVIYLFQAAGLYTIAKRRGVGHAWTAWIFPVWAIGAISDHYQGYANGKKTSRRKILLGLMIGVLVFVILFVIVFGVLVAAGIQGNEQMLAGSAVGFVILWLGCMALGITTLVFSCISLYDIYRSCDPGHATLFLVLSLVLGIGPILLFADRKKDLGMISWQQRAWQQQQWQAQQAWQAQQWQQQQWQAQQAWQRQQWEQARQMQQPQMPPQEPGRPQE